MNNNTAQAQPTGPAVVIPLTDDALIKTLLVQHGREAAVAKMPEYPEKFRKHVSWKDDFFYYIVTHYWGFVYAKDNGYSAWIILRSSVTEEDFLKLHNHLTHIGADSGPDAIPLTFVHQSIGAN